jgi:NAD(P)H dehydrogenase (quinone)
MTDQLIAVTGAARGVGRRVAQRLADAGVTSRLVVRDPTRAPDLPAASVVQAAYDRPDAIRTALQEVTTLFLVSAHEHPDRVALHAGVVDAAREAGVARVVYLSFLGAAPDATFTFARDHFHTEQYIRRGGAAFTFLRDSLYLDVLPFFASGDGALRGPAGDGRVGAVARDDIADVAATVLRGAGPDGTVSDHDGRTYDLTGPTALTLHEVAAELTRATGRAVRYHPETVEEAYASRARFGAAEYEVTGWVTSYTAIAAGEMDVVTDAVAAIAGHPPMSFAGWLAANPHRLRHLRP